MTIFSRLLLSLTFGMILTCTGGCQGLAAILDKTADPTEPAKYVPTRDYMVVLIEAYKNPALVEVLADHMEHEIAEELIAHKVVPIINPNRLTLLRADHPDEFRKLNIPAIGAQVGAHQILYADIIEFTVESTSGTDVHRGRAEARVKVVDVKTGKTRWPQEGTSSGYQVIVDIPFGTDSHENISQSVVRQALGQELAAHIARLMYNAASKDPDAPPSYPESDMR